MSKQQDAHIEIESENKKPHHYLSGVAASVTLWWCGVLFLVFPSYCNIIGFPASVSNVIGYIFITISFAGALLELSKLWKSEAFSYFGIAALFLVPAILLIIAIQFNDFPDPIEMIGKLIIFFLLLVGGSMIFYGIPHFFPDINKNQNEVSNDVILERSRTRVDLQTKISLITALLALITVIIKIQF